VGGGVVAVASDDVEVADVAGAVEPSAVDANALVDDAEVVVVVGLAFPT